MKKNKLIELLTDIKGNPEIYLWNGYVEDFVDIDKDFIPDKLYKESYDHVLNCITMERMIDKGDFNITEAETLDCAKVAREVHAKRSWDFPNMYTTEDERKTWYQPRTKNIVIINTKERGKRYSDRAGSVQY